MKYNPGFKKIENLSPSLREEITQKLFTAEDDLAKLRVTVIAINTLIYLVFMEPEKAIPWLANIIIGVSWSYALVLLFFRPYRRYYLLNTFYFTSGTDVILITLWIFATGGADSPFYLLWYVSIIAIAMRFTFRLTIIVSLLYCVIYATIFTKSGALDSHLADMLTRCSYLFLIAMGSGLLSKEAFDQIQDKIIIKESQEEIRKQGALLKEANERLEERVKERTRELKESNRELQRINEDIDNFVYAASHDLKAPILNVKALLELLYENGAQTEEAEETREIKAKIGTALERVLITINHLSEIAKAQIEVHEDIEHIRFEEVLKEVIADNEEVLKRAQAKVIHDFEPANAILFSRTGLKSIMHNFITNSVKYKSPERTPTIEVRTEDTGEHLVLSISDNGLGMDLQRHGNKLFSVFKRFHTHVEGAGIGLYMVKRIVERNKGKIEVESEVNKGTTFRIKFFKEQQTAL